MHFCVVGIVHTDCTAHNHTKMGDEKQFLYEKNLLHTPFILTLIIHNLKRWWWCNEREIWDLYTSIVCAYYLNSTLRYNEDTTPKLRDHVVSVILDLSSKALCSNLLCFVFYIVGIIHVEFIVCQVTSSTYTSFLFRFKNSQNMNF